MARTRKHRIPRSEAQFATRGGFLRLHNFGTPPTGPASLLQRNWTMITLTRQGPIRAPDPKAPEGDPSRSPTRAILHQNDAEILGTRRQIRAGPPPEVDDHEMGLGEAVWADFGCKMNCKPNPIDLDRFRRDPTRKSAKTNLNVKIACLNQCENCWRFWECKNCRWHLLIYLPSAIFKKQDTIVLGMFWAVLGVSARAGVRMVTQSKSRTQDPCPGQGPLRCRRRPR